jgi:tetratricopeptide (TPR) repeat protein
MRKYLIILALFSLAINSSGQDNEIEQWRDSGYLAKTAMEYDSAIFYYRRVLDADPSDYDAKLALARLHLMIKDYSAAESLFTEIYRNDSTDVEAMNGLGEICGLLGQDKLSIYYYERALLYLPEEIEQYFYLAKAYGNGNRLEEAIDVYRRIMRIDDTYAEAWAGIGRMYFWMGKPRSACDYYERAIELDPGDEAIMKEFTAVKTELDYALSFHFGPVNEKEESYEINAMISKVGFEKRLHDHFHIQANFLLDYSNRNYTDDAGDTTRWYNSSWLKGSWIAGHHSISAYGGYSNTDDKFSTYGLNWKLNYQAGKVSIRNSLNAGYDYFYYWNKVGGKSVTDEIRISYLFIGFNAGYTFGIIDPVNVYLSDETTGTSENPYQSYSLSVNFRICKRPDVRLGINHSYLNYEYKSPLYYSPFDRRLTGASASIYYDYSKLYIYGSFSYNIGTEYTSPDVKEDKIHVDNWSANLELGYSFYPFSFSIGGSNFYNPYYQNITGFLAAKMLF